MSYAKQEFEGENTSWMITDWLDGTYLPDGENISGLMESTMVMASEGVAIFWFEE